MLFVFNLIVLLVRVTLFLATLNSGYLWNSAVYTIVFSVAPFFCWIRATEYENFNYTSRKMWFLSIFLINALLMAITPFLRFGLYAICPYILQHIKISEVFSYDKAVWLCRFAVLLLPTLILALFGKILYSIYTSDFCMDMLQEFKLSHGIDIRKDKKWLYDLCIVNNLSTGKPIIVQEGDRGTHCTLIGQTGTGKTATGFYPAIVSDMNNKIRNDDLREQALYMMVRDGKAILNLPEHAEGERVFVTGMWFRSRDTRRNTTKFAKSIRHAVSSQLHRTMTFAMVQPVLHWHEVCSHALLMRHQSPSQSVCENLVNTGLV